MTYNEIEKISKLLIKDLDKRQIKAWRIKHGLIKNPYPISQNYIYFLSNEKLINKVGESSLLKMKYFFESKIKQNDNN
jgi:hypothetical protein